MRASFSWYCFARPQNFTRNSCRILWHQKVKDFAWAADNAHQNGKGARGCGANEVLQVFLHIGTCGLYASSHDWQVLHSCGSLAKNTG
jgi:hypothetical protein